jgi:hypothetical protein
MASGGARAGARHQKGRSRSARLRQRADSCTSSVYGLHFPESSLTSKSILIWRDLAASRRGLPPKKILCPSVRLSNSYSAASFHPQFQVLIPSILLYFADLGEKLAGRMVAVPCDASGQKWFAWGFDLELVCR